MAIDREAGGGASGKAGRRADGVRRGRPTADQAAALTARIVRKAAEIFLSEGFAGTSMDAVALGAGVSKNTLYARFPGKPELFRAVVADRMQAWSRLSAPGAGESGSAASDRLAARARDVFAALGDPEVAAFRRLVLREAGDFPELAEDLQFLGHRRLVHDVSVDIARSDADDATKGRAEAIAAVFVAALMGWWQAESAFAPADPSRADAFARSLVAVLLGSA